MELKNTIKFLAEWSIRFFIPVFIMYFIGAWIGCIESLSFDYLDVSLWPPVGRFVFAVLSGLWLAFVFFMLIQEIEI